jgi:hypothetical protein
MKTITCLTAFIFTFFIFDIHFCQAQSYKEYTVIADSLFNRKEYSKCTAFYCAAFKSQGDNGLAVIDIELQ